MSKTEKPLTILLLTAVLGFVGWALNGMWDEMKSTHDVLIFHSVAITNIQNDVGEIKTKLRDVPTRQEMDNHFSKPNSFDGTFTTNPVSLTPQAFGDMVH